MIYVTQVQVFFTMDYILNSTQEATGGNNINANTTANNSSDLQYANEIQFICYCIVIPILACAGLIGNTFAFITLCKHDTIPGSISVLLNGLIISDVVIIFLALITMTLLSLSLNNSNFSYFIDVIYPNIFPVSNFLVMVSQQCNVWLTVALASERYIAICHPFHTVYFRKKKNSVAALLLITSLSVLFNTPRLFAFAIKSYQVKGKDNTFYDIAESDFGTSNFYQSSYSVWMYAVFIYIIPIFLLVSFSIPTVRQLFHMSKKLKSIKQQLYKEFNMTAFILAVVGCFLLCQTPGIFAQLQGVFSDSSTIILFSISNTIFVFNSSINFFIYTMSSRFTFVIKRFCRQKGSFASESLKMSKYITTNDENSMSKQCHV